MAKKLTLQQKEEIVKLFISDISIDQISHKFNCTKLTISRNLKKILGEKKYKEILNKNKIFEINDVNLKKNKSHKIINSSTTKSLINNSEDEYLPISPLIEIPPLNYEIDIYSQKDFASVPISEVEFPKVVYMIVDNKVELEIKCLKDYPKWEFLSPDELERKTIEIYFDLKVAKGFCSKEQKVIKVPNTDVFKKVTPILLSRGISRIVSSDKLIAL